MSANECCGMTELSGSSSVIHGGAANNSAFLTLWPSCSANRAGIRRHRMVWDKGAGWVNAKIGKYSHEDILVFSKSRSGWYVNDAALLELPEDPTPPTDFQYLRHQISSSNVLADEAKTKAHADLDRCQREGCTVVDLRLPNGLPDHRGSTSGTGKRGRAFAKGEACLIHLIPTVQSGGASGRSRHKAPRCIRAYSRFHFASVVLRRPAR